MCSLTAFIMYFLSYCELIDFFHIHPILALSVRNNSLRVGSYPLARRLLRPRMIGEIPLSQAPNKVLWDIPPPEAPDDWGDHLVSGPQQSALGYPPTRAPAEQLLPRSCRTAHTLLRCGYVHGCRSTATLLAGP